MQERYHKIQAPELRRVRREALLRARATQPAPSGWPRRSSASRSARTRGTATRRSTSTHGHGRRSSSNINGSPYHHGKGAERLEICRDSRAADRRMDRLRERGRRPGRAGVRRWVDGRVPGRRGGRARLDVRGGPGHRSTIDAAEAPASTGAPDHRGPTGPRRSIGRSSSASATTSGRTGSARWWSGMSGGIDSALVATLAADALGPGSGARARDAVAVLVARRASRTRWSVRTAWAPGSTRCRSTTCSTRTDARSPTSSRERRKASPRRTCRLGSAGTC